MPGGTAASDMRTESPSRLHVLHTITAHTARLTAGAIHPAPGSTMRPPATTTAAATPAPPPPRAAATRRPVAPLTATPAAATIITVRPATGAADAKRPTASHAMAPTAVSRNTALNSAARIEELRRP